MFGLLRKDAQQKAREAFVSEVNHADLEVFFFFVPFFHFIFFNSACDRVAGVLIHSSRILELGSKGFTSLEHVMRGLCIFVMHCSNW